MAPSAATPAVAASVSVAERAFIDTLSQRTFGYFWETTNPRNGLTPDRWPTKSFSSVAAVGFALTAYPIGVEHGWVTRDAARERVLTTLRFFWRAPQGPQGSNITGYKGFYYHFLDMETGYRFENVELSTIDTALLIAGALVCRQYFDRDDAGDREIRALTDSIYGRVDWPWARAGGTIVNMGWRPEPASNQDARGFNISSWRGYDEGMILYILALGSPTHAIEPAAWTEWTRTYRWDRFQGQEFLQFSPLFGHQYSHIWIDFRGVKDAYMSGRGIDYFENSRRAVLSQRAYATENPNGWR
ncbi:MAG TPA: glucoamylase family protein, partial [Gemmatimonadaceae bacterium]|nr:glucoamylase family protein [Gemmatimonadaceae bacterium]